MCFWRLTAIYVALCILSFSLSTQNVGRDSTLCNSLRATSGNERVLILKGCDAKDLFNILDSIYSRGRRVKSVDAAASLAKLASVYGDGILKAECDALLAFCADRPCSILAPKARSSIVQCIHHVLAQAAHTHLDSWCRPSKVTEWCCHQL